MYEHEYMARMARELELETDVVELDKLARQIDDRIATLRHAKLPRGIIEAPCRPRYLEGCTGKVGDWCSDTRRYFFPDPGTEAHRRGTEWRVTASTLRMLGDGGPLDEPVEDGPSEFALMSAEERAEKIRDLARKS